MLHRTCWAEVRRRGEDRAKEVVSEGGETGTGGEDRRMRGCGYWSGREDEEEQEEQEGFGTDDFGVDLADGEK